VDALSIENMEFASSQNDEADFNFIYSDMLGQDDFELLKMITLDGYTMLDASRKYKISVEACKKRVQRARAKFKKLVKDIS
jgi:DNA-directed RNA polymerase specialized sigma24 family protein